MNIFIVIEKRRLNPSTLFGEKSLIELTASSLPSPSVILIEEDIDEALKDFSGELLLIPCGDIISVTEVETSLGIFRGTKADGGILYQISDEERGIYCIFDEERLVKEIQEGSRTFFDYDSNIEVESRNKVVSPYWWKDVKEFLECRRTVKNYGSSSLAYAFSQLIGSGGKVKAIPVSTHKSLKDAESLKKYESYKEFNA